MDQLKDRTITSLFWKILERGGNAAIQLVIQIVMARLLAPEEFGSLAIMLVFVNLGNVIVQSGLNTALIQSPDASDDDFSTVFWMCASISIGIYVLVFFASPMIASFYAMSQLVWPLRVLMLLVLVNSLNSVQVAKVTREMNMSVAFRASIISVACSAVAGIGSAWFGMGVWALVIQQLMYQSVNCIVMYIQIPWSPRFVFNAVRARKLFCFGWRLLASGLINTAYQSLGSLIIGKQFNAVKLGLVSQGEKYPQAVGSLLDGAIQPVMLSAVSHIQSDKVRVKRLVRRALKTSTFLIFPAMTLFACCAPSIVPLLLGTQWNDSIPYLQVYCFVYALLPIHTTNLQALNGVGRSDVFLKLELIKKTYGVTNLLFCAFVLKSVDALVASYMITGLISTIVNAWPNRRIIGYSYGEQVRDIVPSIILSGISALPTLLLVHAGLSGVLLVAAQVVVFAAFYVLLSSVFRIEAFSYICKTVREVIGSEQ